MKNSLLLLALINVLAFAGTGCKISFNGTGGKLDNSLQTIYVANFINEADIVVSYLAQTTTQRIQERFLNQSRLSLTSGSSADVAISGSIEDYRISPVALTGTTAASQNRLTIRVRVKYENRVDEKGSWEKSFSKFVDFNAEEDFSRLEQSKIDEILEQITQDIFNESLGKW